MAISFEIPQNLLAQMDMVKGVAEYVMRPLSRELDENEHQRPEQFFQMTWGMMRDNQKRQLDKLMGGDSGKKREGPARQFYA